MEPGVGDSYFQNASMLVEEPNFSRFRAEAFRGASQFAATAEGRSTLSRPGALDLKDEPVFKLDLATRARATSHGRPSGRQGGDHRDRTQTRERHRSLAARASRAQARAAYLVVEKREAHQAGPGSGWWMRDEMSRGGRYRASRYSPAKAARFYSALEAGHHGDRLGTCRRAASHARHAAQCHRSPARLRPGVARHLSSC